jgi:hypothetical protein
VTCAPDSRACDTGRILTLPAPKHEIITHGFFAPDALPDGIARATRARIAEVLGGAAVSEVW